MNIIDTPIEGLVVIEPKIFQDDRGYFFESYNKNNLHEKGIHIDFVQDNQSSSSYSVIRGLHYQKHPKAQTKLVRVIKGKIFDVAVDIRPDSASFGKWYGIELSEENKKQFLIPKGFAHGFSVLSESAVVFYKCDEFYAPQYDSGIVYNDPELNIDWKIPEEKAILSAKDLNQPLFKTLLR